MSFTVIRHKDGVPVPIKVSIWDAFKGAPEPKRPKPKEVSPEPLTGVVLASPPVFRAPALPMATVPTECPCCHKMHTSSPPADNNKNKDHKKARNKNSDGDGDSKGEKQAQHFSTHDQESYSKADDKKIIEMKMAGERWKNILQAIGKESLSQLKQHWKTINPDGDGNKDDEDGKSKKSDSKDDGETGKKKQESESKKTDGQAKNKQKQQGTKQGANKLTAEQCELRDWSDRYDRHKWIAAASRHFDLTGQRITPAVAKKLVLGS